MRRPDVFTLDYSHPLAQGLVFAGLGSHHGARRCHDSSLQRNHGAIDSVCSLLHSEELGRAFVSAPNQTSAPGTIAVPQNLSGWGKASTRHTISFWVRWHSVPGYRSFFMGGDWLSYPYIYLADNVFYSAFRTAGDDGLSDQMSFSSSNAPQGKWNNFTICWNSSSLRHSIWVNNVRVATREYGTGLKQAASHPLYLLARPGTAIQADIADFMWWVDRDLGNSQNGSSEIALLADRTDPMLGGLIVEERPVLYFDMGAIQAVEGPAIITAESVIAILGQKGALGPATVAATASIGMGCVKGVSAPLNIVGTSAVGASGQKSTSSPATISAQSSLGMGGVKAIIGVDKEGPATFAGSSSVGMGGVKGAVSQAWIGADSEVVAAGVKGGVGSAAWLAAGGFLAGKGPDVTEITADEVRGRVVLASVTKNVIMSARNRTVVHGA